MSTPTANVAQHLERTTDAGKLDLLTAMLVSEAQTEANGGPPMPLTIVFVERKTRCDETAEALNGDGVRAVALHGGLSQWEREGALRDFSSGQVKVLIATDVASRGLDIKGAARRAALFLSPSPPPPHTHTHAPRPAIRCALQNKRRACSALLPNPSFSHPKPFPTSKLPNPLPPPPPTPQASGTSSTWTCPSRSRTTCTASAARVRGSRGRAAARRALRARGGLKA